MSDSDEDVVYKDTADSADYKNKKKYRYEMLIYVIVVILAVILVPRYIAQRTVVDGESMMNTLNNGDNLIVEKISYKFSDPDRFDIVVFYPFGKKAKEYYIKRVIGLPREHVCIKDSTIYIDGEVLEENYGKDLVRYAGIAENGITLGEDEYFLMGDNRLESFDSRYPEIGPVSKDKIAGRAVLRIYPFKQFGSLTDK